MSDIHHNEIAHLVQSTGLSEADCKKAIDTYGLEKAKSMLLLKRIREITNCGIQHCKEALQESDYDLDKAIHWLREKYKVSFEKRASKDTLEGAFGVYEDARHVCIVEMLCETDFVANNPGYRHSANEVAKLIAHHQSILEDKENFIRHHSVPHELSSTITSFLENIRIGRAKVFEKNKGPVYWYQHESGSNKIIAALQFAPNFGQVLAKQIVATNPKTIHLADVTNEIMSQHPDVKKEELALMSQAYMFDSKITVADYLKTIHPIDFMRMCIGEI